MSSISLLTVAGNMAHATLVWVNICSDSAKLLEDILIWLNFSQIAIKQEQKVSIRIKRKGIINFILSQLKLIQVW